MIIARNQYGEKYQLTAAGMIEEDSQPYTLLRFDLKNTLTKSLRSVPYNLDGNPLDRHGDPRMAEVNFDRRDGLKIGCQLFPPKEGRKIIKWAKAYRGKK